MSPDRPATISVVIPAYNAEAFIGAAVRSVLAQTWTDLECVVVNDGSTDATRTVLAAIDDPRLRTIDQANLGVSQARNNGVASCAGEFIAFLDADDTWMPSKLDKQMAVFASRPEVGAVLASYIVSGADLSPHWVVPSGDPERRFTRWLLMEGDGPSFPSSVLLRRACFDVVGGFDGSVAPSEDLHFALRLSSRFPVASLDEPLVRYRMHSEQIHRDLSSLEANMLKIFGDVLADPSQAALRRRATANLYTRLFFHNVRRRSAREALRCLRTALAVQPTRLMALPTQVGVRRVRGQLERAVRRWSPSAEVGRQRRGEVGEVGPPR